MGSFNSSFVLSGRLVGLIRLPLFRIRAEMPHTKDFLPKKRQTGSIPGKRAEAPRENNANKEPVPGSTNKTRLRGCWAVIAVAVLACTACSKHAAFPRPEELDKVFHNAAEPSEGLVRDLDVYIDGSGSMLGFVRASMNRYHAVVAEILNDSADTGRLSVKRFRFPAAGGRGTSVSVSNMHVAEILSPAFYYGGDTPLGKLLYEIAGRP